MFTGRDAHGKRSYLNQTVHGTEREADQELRKLLAPRDTGRLHVKPKQSVDEYLDVWLETVVRPQSMPKLFTSSDTPPAPFSSIDPLMSRESSLRRRIGAERPSGISVLSRSGERSEPRRTFDRLATDRG